MAQAQSQCEPRAALLERVDQILAGDQAIGGLTRLVVALVGTTAQHLAGKQARVALDRNTARVCCTGARVQTGQMHPGREQQRHARMQHVRDRRVDPLHRRRRPGRPVAGAVRELAADGTRVTERGEGAADLFARQRRIVMDQRQPFGGPTQRFDEFSRQAERKIEGTDPVARSAQPGAEIVEGRMRLQGIETHAVPVEGS